MSEQREIISVVRSSSIDALTLLRKYVLPNLDEDENRQLEVIPAKLIACLQSAARSKFERLAIDTFSEVEHACENPFLFSENMWRDFIDALYVLKTWLKSFNISYDTESGLRIIDLLVLVSGAEIKKLRGSETVIVTRPCSKCEIGDAIVDSDCPNPDSSPKKIVSTMEAAPESKQQPEQSVTDVAKSIESQPDIQQHTVSQLNLSRPFIDIGTISELRKKYENVYARMRVVVLDNGKVGYKATIKQWYNDSALLSVDTTCREMYFGNGCKIGVLSIKSRVNPKNNIQSTHIPDAHQPYGPRVWHLSEFNADFEGTHVVIASGDRIGTCATFKKLNFDGRMATLDTSLFTNGAGGLIDVCTSTVVAILE